MTWVTTLWLVIAATCATLAAIHAHVWLRQREAVGNLAFAFLAISVAGMGYAELRMLQAPTVDEFGRFLWWYQIPVWSGVVSLVCFVRLYLRVGRTWLGALAIGLRTVAMVVNFVSSPALPFREITSLERVTLFGETLNVAQGVPNPWLAIAHLALLAVILFVADAARDLWRQRRRRQAFTIGGSLVVFVTAGTATAVLAFWGLARVPLFVAILFLPIVFAMAYELGLDLIDAARVSAELQAKRAELEHLARVATLSELSGALAHELNQPLGIIMANAEAAQRLLERDPPDVAEIGAILDDIVAADERAGHVIQRLRGMLKRGKPDRKSLSLNRAVEDVVRFMRTDLVRRGVAVEISLDPRMPAVSADRVPLEQVLINVVTNACEAMTGNANADRTVKIATSVENGMASLSISDTGCGLPAPPDSVFAPFYTTKPEGLGMGLAISRSIISAHGGRLWAEAAQGRGAIFHIHLPLEEAAV